MTDSEVIMKRMKTDAGFIRTRIFVVNLVIVNLLWLVACNESDLSNRNELFSGTRSEQKKIDYRLAKDKSVSSKKDVIEFCGKVIPNSVYAIVESEEASKSFKNILGLAPRREIAICEPSKLEDLEPISQFKEIKIISIPGANISDLGPISELRSLEYLNIKGTKVASLSQIQNLTHLYFLNAENTQIKDIEAVANWPQLNTLFFIYILITSLSPLRNAKNLSTLEASRTNVESLEPLSELPILDTLFLKGTKVRDLHPLKKNQTLTSLNLSGTKVDNIEIIKELKNLKLLLLFDTIVSSEQIESLKNTNSRLKIFK